MKRSISIRLLPPLAALAAVALVFACFGEEPDGSGPRHEVRVNEDESVDLFHGAWSYSEPVLAARANGEGAAAWLAFDGERDRVCAALFDGRAWGEAIELSPGPCEAFAPVIAAADDGDFWVVWSARTDGALDLWARRFGRQGAGEAERVTHDPAADVEPAVAVGPGGELVVAWQTVRGANQEIVVRRHTNDGWGSPIRATDDPAADLLPALGVDAAGRAWLAWSTWRDGTYADGNYEVFAGRVGELALEDARRVSTSARADLFPRFALAGERLALVWCESAFALRRMGEGDETELLTVAYDQWRDKSYRVAWLDGDAFGAPGPVRAHSLAGDVLVVSDFAVPVRAPNAEGLWLVHQTLFETPAVRKRWALAVSRIAGGVEAGDGETRPFDASSGVAGSGGRFDAAWFGDRLFAIDAASTVEQGETPVAKWTSWLRVREVRAKRPASLKAKAPQKLLAEAAPADLLAESTRRPMSNGPGGRQRVTVALEQIDATGGEARALTAYFGNLHVHSDLSTDGRGHEGTPELNYQVVHDLAGLDFAGLSDHVEWFQREHWWAVRKATELWNRPGEFVTLPGYEWTSFKHGHKNVFFRDAAEADSAAAISALGTTPDDLWERLGERAALTIPHHTSRRVNEPTDWAFRNDAFQRLVEIFQVRGNYEYDGAPYQSGHNATNSAPGHGVRSALRKGHRLGIIASPDHGGGFGLAGVWADELTRESVYEALHARRTFGTTGAALTVWLTVEGVAQGGELEHATDGVSLHAEVTGTADDLTLTVVSDGEDLSVHEFRGRRAQLDWTDRRPLAAGTRYYYLRVRQGDGHLAWSSPVWVETRR